MKQLEKVGDMVQSIPNQSQTRYSEYQRIIILVFSLKRPTFKLKIKRLLELQEAAVGENLSTSSAYVRWDCCSGCDSDDDNS